MVSDRFYISSIGEYYYDCLKIEAFLKGRTMAAEGATLLCSNLMKREEYREKLIAYYARKRGISLEQMWDDIVTGKAQPLTPEEFEKLRSSQEESE